MNVSDLLQDSPSQHRKRPSGLEGTTTNPAATTTTPSSSSSSSSPVPQSQSQNPTIIQSQPAQAPSSSTSGSTPRPPPPTANAPYSAPPSGPYYAPSPFVPPRIITPRQPPDQPMASLQHPHPHPSWGPRNNSGSSPHVTTGSSRAPPPLPVGLSSFLFAFHDISKLILFFLKNEFKSRSYRKKSSNSTPKSHHNWKSSSHTSVLSHIPLSHNLTPPQRPPILLKFNLNPKNHSKPLLLKSALLRHLPTQT
jgi:hypothetical protein